MKYFFSAIIFCWTATTFADTKLTENNATPDITQLSLGAAESLWKKNNREMQIARDQVAASGTEKLRAAQSPNPQLSFNTASIHPPGNTFPHGTDSSMRIDQLIERGDKRNLRVSAANLQYDAARLDLDDTSRQSQLRLHQSYYDLLTAQEILQITQDNAALYASTVQAVQLRVRAGDLAPSDLARLQVDTLRADNDMQVASDNVRQAQQALGYMLGLETEIPRLHAINQWPQHATGPAILSEDAIEAAVLNRADVRAALQRIDAADVALDLAMAQRKRDITVGVQVEHNGSNTPLNSVGLGISVPLMTGYEYAGEIARAQADARTASDTLAQVRAQARGEIATSYSTLSAAAARIERYDSDLLHAARSALDASEFGYKHGALSLTDLLDARRTYKAILIEAIQVRADYAKALTAWNLSTRPATAINLPGSNPSLENMQFTGTQP